MHFLNIMLIDLKGHPIFIIGASCNKRDLVKALHYRMDRFSALETGEGFLHNVPDLDNIEETYLAQRGEFLVGIDEGKLVGSKF